MEDRSKEEAKTRFWVKVGAIFTVLIFLHQIANQKY